MFNSIKDFAYALLEGKEFINSEDKGGTRENQKYLFKNGFKAKPKDYNGYLDMDSYDWSRYNKVTEVVEPKWYDDIPKQGVLCWVWDNGMNKHKRSSAIKIIHSRTSYLGETYFYDAVGDAWDCAKPLTQKEVLQFIYQGNIKP